MEFVLENYMWFSIGGIILLMTLIGYIADKSNYMEKQKDRDNKKKVEYENKKKTHLTYGKKAFNKEIGTGQNLVLGEDLLTYPVVFDREPIEIVIPKQEVTTEEVVIDELESEKLVDIDVNNMAEETVAIEPQVEEVIDETVLPVEENVQTDDAFAPSKEEEDIWNF